MHYYVALCSSLKLLSLESILRIQQQKYDIHVPTHTTLYIDFLTSNFGRVDFGNLFFVVWRAKKKKKQGGGGNSTTHTTVNIIYSKLPI